MLDHTLRNLRAVFPDMALIPVPRGVDPLDVPLPLITEVDTPAYQTQLATHNIGVALGQQDGLLAVRFEHEVAMDEFLDRNPPCRSTLVTAHAGRPTVWLRAKTTHRVSLSLPGLGVVMRGSLLVASRHGLEKTDSILNPSTPHVVNLESINWGPDADGLIDSWLTQLSHGEFFRRNSRGQLTPNGRAWRHYLTRRLRTHLAYDPSEMQFFELTGARDWRPVTEDQLRRQVRELITMAPVDAPEAKARLSDEWSGQVCRRLKSSLEAHLPIEEARLRVFANQHLVKEPGANTTSAELTQAFAAHCQQTGQAALSPKQFTILVGRILRGEPWLVCRSKSIRRSGREQNGWRGLKLRDAKPANGLPGGVRGADGAEI